MKSYHEMTREELWEEFENQLIRETRTSMTMNFDEAERMTKLGIKETVAKWKDRLEQEPCKDWYDVPSDEMTLEQARQAVKDLRKKLAEYLEQEPCEDAISRQSLISAFPISDTYTLDDIIATIKFQPPVKPTRKKGKWRIKDGKESGYDIAGVKTCYIQIVCDRCGFIKTAIEGHCGQYNFCPNCGADMREVEE